MKTILRIISIVLVAAVVAGAFFLAVNNTSSASGTNEGGSPPLVTGTNGLSFQPVERPESGDSNEGSLIGGLTGVLGTLAKLTGITVLVLLIQKGSSMLGNRKFIPSQQ